MPVKGSKKIAIEPFIKAVEDYLAECKANKTVPLLLELAERLDISDDTLTRYVQNSTYNEYIKKVRRATEKALINKGLNENKPVMSIFLLKSKFGYIEQQKLDLTSNGETLGVIAMPAKKR